MKTWSAAIGLLLATVLPAAATDSPLMCLGNEPAWSLALETPDTARLMLPDESPADYQGTVTRSEALHERVWRGRRAGAGGDLVVFLREVECRDGTWEVTGFNNGRHAVVSPLIGTTLTVSFQDGSVVGHAGCNNFRATYTRVGDRLTIGPAAATRKACEGKGVMEQERQFLAAIESTTTWAIDRDMLDLHRADGERALFARESVK